MKPILQSLLIIAASLTLLSASGCGRGSSPDNNQQNGLAGDQKPAPEMAGANDSDSAITVELAPYATALLTAAEGYSTSGNVQFMRLEGRNVRVIGHLVDLPQGDHGLRIVQSGDCRDITGVVSSRIAEIESAALDEGDAVLPNGGYIATLNVGTDNLASIDMYVDQLILDGPGSIAGKPVVVGQADENPTVAEANDADIANIIACGVITLNAIAASELEQNSQ